MAGLLVSYLLARIRARVEYIVECTFGNGIYRIYVPPPDLAVRYTAFGILVVYPVYLLHTFLITYSASLCHRLLLLWIIWLNIQFHLRAHYHPAAAATLGTSLLGNIHFLFSENPGRKFGRSLYDTRAATSTAQGYFGALLYILYHTLHF